MTTTSYAAPGWYADPERPGYERYWNGGMWQAGGRPAMGEAVQFPEAENPAAAQSAVVAATGTAFEQRLLDLAARQAAAQERATLYLAWMLALMCALIAVGVVAGVLAS